MAEHAGPFRIEQFPGNGYINPMHLNAVYAKARALAGAALVSLLAGCATPPPAPGPEVTDTITHIGLMGDPSLRFDEGVVSEHLTEYGNHGFGELAGRSGSAILLDGIVYLVQPGGAVTQGLESVTLRAGMLTQFEPDRMFDVSAMSMPLFERALDMRRRVSGVPQALRVEGVFERMELQLPDGGQRNLAQVAGVMVGYYYPPGLSSVFAGRAYRFHFLDDPRSVGGLVRDFEISGARISVDHSPYLRVILPQKERRPETALPVDPSAIR